MYQETQNEPFNYEVSESVKIDKNEQISMSSDFKDVSTEKNLNYH